MIYVRMLVSYGCLFVKVCNTQMAGYVTPAGVDRGRRIIWPSSSASLPLFLALSRELGGDYVSYGNWGESVGDPSYSVASLNVFYTCRQVYGERIRSSITRRRPASLK